MTHSLPILRTLRELKSTVRDWQKHGLRIGLVPTMGALHHGHLSLVQQIAQHVDKVIVSIFVNPTQFGEGEDFDVYPRDEAGDAAKLISTPADLLYAPHADTIYPDGFDTTVSVGALARIFEGAARPGHFDGVATVVTKLFQQTEANCAIFGEKDYQQLAVLKKVARDLDLKTEIIGAPIVREVDGLAASSRNRYLSQQERVTAGRLNGILQQTVNAFTNGADARQLEKNTTQALLKAGFQAVDYAVIVDKDTLAPTNIPGHARLLATAHIGKVRLLDNMPC